MHDSSLGEAFPHFVRQIVGFVTSIALPIVLLPFHFFFLFLSISTTLLASLLLFLRVFLVYLDVIVHTAGQIYADYTHGGRKQDKRRRDLLRKVANQREEAVRGGNERLKYRGRGATIT